MAGIIPMSNVMYPTAPRMLPWSEMATQQGGAWRPLQFGPYLFPVTFQERTRESKLALIKKKVPFVPGDFNPGNTSMSGRTLEFFGTMGVGLIGSNGNLITNQQQLETERQMLAGLQNLGRQSLYVGADQFIWAYLEDFTFAYVDGSGFRFADWSAKFYCDDPRYYGASSWSQYATLGEPVPPFMGAQGGLPNMNVITIQRSGTNGGAVGGTPYPLVHNGNTRAFPIFVLTINAGSYAQPEFLITTTSTNGATQNEQEATGIGIRFSKFQLVTGKPAMLAGDMLVVMCDPRPEYQMIAATYYPGVASGGGGAMNAMQFCVPGAGDLINGIDFQYFAPWISSSTVSDGTRGMNNMVMYFNNSQVDGSGTVEHTLQIMYYDTFI